MEDFNKKELQVVIKNLKEKIKEFKKNRVFYYNEKYCEARKYLELCIEKLDRIKETEKELKNQFAETQKENELQQIPYLTRRLSDVTLNKNKQKAEIYQWLLDHNGIGDAYTIEDDTQKCLSTIRARLSDLKAEGMIRPRCAIMGKWGKPITQFEIASEVISVQ